VAVKIPVRIPPRMIIGAPSARVACLNVHHISFTENRVSGAYPFFQEIHVETVINDIPMRRPGRMPAAKSLPMEAPVRNPNINMGMEGGMITPREPPDA